MTSVTPKPLPQKRKLRARQIAERYGISTRTVARWTETGILPPPAYINGYPYYDEEAVEQRARMRASTPNTVA